MLQSNGIIVEMCSGSYITINPGTFEVFPYRMNRVIDGVRLESDVDHYVGFESNSIIISRNFI